MTSINLAIMLVSGCAVGLLVLGRYPGGLDPTSGYILFALAAASLLCTLLSRRDSRTLWASLLIAATLAGCARTLISHPPPSTGDLAYYNLPAASDTPRFTITGVVSGEPLLGDRSQQLRIASESLIIANSTPIQVKGDLLAILPPYPQYSFGERLVLQGTLTSPPNLGDFDYAGWLARQGVYSYISFPHITSLDHATEGGISESIASARSGARDALKRNIAEPEASLAIGVVVGDRTNLPDEIVDAFRRTGTTHILAISGQNITSLVGVFWLAWSGKQRRRVMPWWLFAIILVLLIFYTGFTGASPSVIRAAVMGSILLLAPLVRRRYDPMAAIALAAAGMVFLDPDVLLDAGFQLSFLAMWGLIIFAPRLTSWLQKAHLPGVLTYPLAVGLAAQVATLPLLVAITGQIPLVSLFATMTADVTLVYLMMGGIITAILGSLGFLGMFAWLSGLATWLCAWWMLLWVEWWSSLPWASVTIDGFQPAYAVAYYAALFAGVWLFSESRRRAKLAQIWPQVRLALLGAAAAAVWAVAIIMVWAK